MADKVTVQNNFVSIEFENHTIPNFIHIKGKEFVRYGDHNNYPDYLIELYNRNAIHGSIVKGKAAYLYGKGLSYLEDGTTVFQQARVAQWLDTANPYEDWNTVYEKTCRYFELFNGFAWQIIWSLGGTKFDIYCMEFSKLRRSEDGKKIYYCDNWILPNGKPNFSPEKDPTWFEFDAYNPNVRCGTQIFYFRLDVPTTAKYGKLYPLPEYSGCIADIESDIEITSFHYNNLKNGMTASSILTLFNGMPDTDDAKRKIAAMIRGTHSGSLNAGKTMINFSEPGGTEAKVTMLTASELDKQFDQLGKRLQQNIFTSHRVDPVLFGVQTDNGISNQTGEQILVLWDKFLRSYVEPRQEVILKEIRDLSTVIGLDLTNLCVKQTTPVGAELPQDPNVLKLFNNATLQSYFAKKYGVELIADENGSTETVSDTAAPKFEEQNQVNEHLKNITGKQWIQIKRLIREVKGGKTDKATASMMLKNSYGLNDSDIETMFTNPEGQFKAFAKVEEEEIYAMFEAAAINECNEDTFVSEDFIYTQLDAVNKELKFLKHKFANPYENNPEALNKAIIDITTGNPYIKQEDIARQLQIPLLVVTAAVGGLVLGGLLDTTAGTMMPTQKALDLEVPTVETEIYTVYKYVTRPDVPEVETTSRFFCKKMLALSRNGKEWTREALDNLTNTLGEDAWTYRGGFYTNPKTQETTPYCRHIWKSVVKSRKVKK